MEKEPATYAFFDHAADVGVRVRAASLEDLFVAAGRALMEWIGPAPDDAARSTGDISLEADDTEELLVRWLQELLFRFQHEHAYFSGAERLKTDGRRLTARTESTTWGENDAGRFQEVKAVTYHKLEVRCEDGIWSASVIFDI